MKKKLFHAVMITLLVLLILAFVTLAAGTFARSSLAKRYPPPGQLVDVGGYRLHLNCMGQGSPTVILDAGLGDFSLTWGQVQPEIAKITRVCSYDRAGYGWSESSPQHQTAITKAEALHTLLVNAEIPGPYVLVGHSLGGLIGRVYTHSYPDEVAGMVLVDSSHEEMYLRQTAAVPKYIEILQGSREQASQYRLFGLLSSTGIMAMMPQVIPNPGISEAAFEQYKVNWATTDFFDTILAEAQSIDEILAETRALHITSFGDMPLIVLSAGKEEGIPALSEAENQLFFEVRRSLQSDLLKLSTNSKQVIAQQSSHYIQTDQPDLVIESIQEMVEKIRDQ